MYVSQGINYTDFPVLRPFKKENVWQRRLWIIIEDWYFRLPKGTTIIIPTGFTFDGASIPRCLWAFLSPTGLLFRASIIHDFACDYGYLWKIMDSHEDWTHDLKYCYYGAGKEQKFWDKLFLFTSLEDNNDRGIAKYIAYFAIRLYQKCLKEKRYTKRAVYPKYLKGKDRRFKIET